MRQHFSPPDAQGNPGKRRYGLGLCDAVLSFDPKGKQVAVNCVDLEIAIRWRLKDGKIIEHQAFFDTAALLIQQSRLTGKELHKF